METGVEEPAIIIEPIQIPVPGYKQEPAPQEPTPVAPVKQPERELEPVR